jgi:hypothetical protein
VRFCPAGTSKLLVLPVYQAAWPQAKKHSFVQSSAARPRRDRNSFGTTITLMCSFCSTTAPGPQAVIYGNLYFEQVWFPGVHADIGGGYLENEARLSDVHWIVAGVSIIPNGLKHDGSILRLSPNSKGSQHNEQAGSFLRVGVRQLPSDHTIGEPRSPIHKSVYQRFEAEPVLLYDWIGEIAPTTCAYTSTSSTTSDWGHR